MRTIGVMGGTDWLTGLCWVLVMAALVLLAAGVVGLFGFFIACLVSSFVVWFVHFCQFVLSHF